MKKLVIREVGGHFHLENFGSYYTGSDGRASFELVIESQERGITLQFPEATLYDLFSRFNLRDNDFLDGRFLCRDFVKISDQDGRCVVEAPCGTLYDFFQERLASGRCELQAPCPVSFHWNGSSERDVA